VSNFFKEIRISLLYIFTIVSMRKQDFLIQLIQSLNSGERRHFMLSAKLYSGDKLYIQLFELLEQQAEYNVENLCRELNITPNQLAVTKHYLNDTLLHCLRNFEEIESETPGEHLVDLTRRNIEVLIDRGMYLYAVDLLKNALADARRMEMLETICILLSTRIVCWRKLERFEELEQDYTERERMTAVLFEFRELLLIEAKVAAIERNRAQPGEIKKIFEHPLMQKTADELLSLKAKTAWFQTRFVCYLLLGEQTLCLGIAREQHKYYQRIPEIKWVSPGSGIYSYSTLANAELEAGNAARALEIVEQMARAPLLRHLQKNNVLSIKKHAYTFKTELYFKLNRFRELITLVEKADKQLTEGRPVYDQFLSLYYHGLALLHTGQSAEAIIKLNELLQLDDKHRKDLQKYVRPAIILCQLNLGNYATVPYAIKSTRAWMKRAKISSPEVELFLSLAYSIANAPEMQRRERWLKLQADEEEGKLNSLDKEINLKSWLKRKLSRQ
jgi:hypothetical protein